MTTNEHTMKSLCKGAVARVEVATAGHVFYARAYSEPSWEEHAKKLAAEGKDTSMQALAASVAEAARKPIANVQGKNIEEALAALKAALEGVR